MSALDTMFAKMAQVQGHVRVHDCRGMHKSQWRPELGYWVCATCAVPLDEQRRGQWATHLWLQPNSTKKESEMTNELRMWTDTHDWVVATSVEDARAIVTELTGSCESEVDEWEALPNEQVLKVVTDDDPPQRQAKTCAEWVAEGRGHVASADW